MDSGRRVTSIFIAIALLALAALAISVSRRASVPPAPDTSILPGLAENLRSVEELTGYPSGNFGTILITRTNGNELLIARDNVDSRFDFRGQQPTDAEKTAYSGILYANAAFLNAVASDDAYAVSGVVPEQRLGRLVYTGFDGLVLDHTVFRADNATWLHIKASYSAEAAIDQGNGNVSALLPADAVREIAQRLNGRLHREPDNLEKSTDY